MTRYTIYRQSSLLSVRERVCRVQREKRTIVHSLEIVDQRKDVLMAHGDLLEHCYFVPHLRKTIISYRQKHSEPSSRVSHHVFPSLHHPLVDDLGGIVSACVDMYAFFDH